MGESHRKSDSSKSLGSLVQINSIAIDISSVMEEIESPAHEHFSIRGFVAEMRKKDWKACSPFASERDDVDLVDNLPPLFVPKFRWWQCSNCIPHIAMKRSTEEMVDAGRSRDPGTSSCQKYGEKNGLYSHSRESIATLPGNKLGSRDNAGGEDNDPSKTTMNTNSCCIERRKAIACSKDKTDVSDKEAGNPCADKSEANPFQIRHGLSNTADASVCVGVHPSRIVDEPENASSGSDGTFSALPYRRKPKLRSLADIMVEERNPPSDNLRTKSASSGGIQVTSTETEPILSPQAELDVSADAAKAARSPPKKRNIVLEEDRGCSEVIYPNTTKRFRRPILDAEKSSRRVEISEFESEGNASMRLDFGLGAKTQRIKPKKHKAPDFSKTMRQSLTENGPVPARELPKIHAADLQKHAVCSETSFGKLGNAPSTVGETGLHFRSSLPGQHIDKMSNLSESKTLQVESDRDHLMPSSQIMLGDCNVKQKVALELSLNSFIDPERNSDNQELSRQHRGIPDLNETFPLKTVATQGKQLPTVSETRNFPPHTTLFFKDDSASCSKETTGETREGNRQLGVSGPQNKDKNKEPGASDDIPMEIVELLAKNQYERALGSSRRHLLSEGVNSSALGSPPLFIDGRPGMINFPLAGRRTGITVGNGNMEFRQNITTNFPQLNNCRLDINKPEESQFRLFGSTPSQQRETRYSTSSSVMKGPRPSTEAELLWSPARENPPFQLSIPQNRSIQTNNIVVHSFSNKVHLGKTVNHRKSGKGKKAVHDAAVLKEGRNRLRSTSAGPLDPYSNDTIPAMQLLSLMDQRIVPGSSFEVGPKYFLDKPFSPCNHHPRLNGKENQNFLGGSLFSQSSQAKDLPGFHYSVYCSGESSKKASTYLHGQMPAEVGNSKATLAIKQARSDTALGLCTLNRNPADFTIPDARNEFTLSAKDFKFRKKNALKEKSRSLNVDGRKRQRVRKDASGKESSRK